MNLPRRVASAVLPSTSIWELEWDVLCVLDGCRYEDLAYMYPETDGYRSVASMSKTWIEKSIAGDRPGVGYVTGNPFIESVDADELELLHLEEIRSTEYGVDTVPPKAVVEPALEAWSRREELEIERLVVHFMQPHVPFRSRPEWFESLRSSGRFGSSAWRAVDTPIVSKGEWFEAYWDNLAWVLENGVKPLRESVSGTVGVTADHGNALGRFGEYGHPRWGLSNEVRVVPWLELEGLGNEREPNGTSLGMVERPDEEQLRSLGYV